MNFCLLIFVVSVFLTKQKAKITAEIWVLGKEAYCAVHTCLLFSLSPHFLLMTPTSFCPPHLPLTSFCLTSSSPLLPSIMFYCLPVFLFPSVPWVLHVCEYHVKKKPKTNQCHLICNFENLTSNFLIERDILVTEMLSFTREQGKRGGDEKHGLNGC